MLPQVYLSRDDAQVKLIVQATYDIALQRIVVVYVMLDAGYLAYPG